ncbi:DNA mismatch repair protein MutS [Lutibacter sp. HS1-25]|uniref:MutS-related protein n=1 Tax=Lutibacter sp. HS1-25 TaxID=2485000 RepID=UPI0010123E26|nr:DNA mismatch repair protein MutS [Lutibacter sp. HS1-25]RXP44584.1 DNA mismatch repair protein MutS [Lutibacter sp. HS1-25]
MKQQPSVFYHEQLDLFEKEASKLKKQLAISSLARLFTFLLTIFGVYLVFGHATQMLLVVGVGLALFIYFLFKHSDLQYKFDLNKALVNINKIEIKVLERDYFTLDEGREFINPKHPYSYDIDLFGRGSFFQYCNRTATVEGKNELFKKLTSNSISDIQENQDSIEDLSEKAIWRQHFSAIASLVKVEHSAKEIVSWIHNYKVVFPVFLKYLASIFSLLSVAFIVLVAMRLIPDVILLLWFVIGVVISGLYLKKVNELYKKSSDAKETVKQYHKLLNEIEITSFSSEILKKKQQEIKTEGEKASLIFKEYSKMLDAFDQRNNLIVGVIGNGFFLMDLSRVCKIEKWIETYKNKVENWFEVIAFFDAQNALANFKFNHPNYVFPKINSDISVIKAKNLGHTLLKEKQRVDNDFTINNHQFYIITGANMAGKSTFLRTVSLSIVMANMGLPVCAESFEYNPIKLITSMRTTDSLADDESYFFSELKRLKYIVDEIKAAKYFIILDEILKGTNSTDKAIGSRKFVQKLVASNATGIIATHDLSLCEIEKELNEVENYYFDAEIVNDELHFDYQLKDGICKNMNASFLLKKMEIV